VLGQIKSANLIHVHCRTILINDLSGLMSFAEFDPAYLHGPSGDTITSTVAPLQDRLVQGLAGDQPLNTRPRRRLDSRPFQPD
jgi:hypothetical protein